MKGNLEKQDVKPGSIDRGEQDVYAKERVLSTHTLLDSLSQPIK